MLSLEDECMQRIALHKYAILKAKIMDYYRTIRQGEVNIPEFMDDFAPERLADIELRKLVLSDMDKFNRLYEVAYEELAEILE